MSMERQREETSSMHSAKNMLFRSEQKDISRMYTMWQDVTKSRVMKRLLCRPYDMLPITRRRHYLRLRSWIIYVEGLSRDTKPSIEFNLSYTQSRTTQTKTCSSALPPVLYLILFISI